MGDKSYEECENVSSSAANEVLLWISCELLKLRPMNFLTLTRIIER